MRLMRACLVIAVAMTPLCGQSKPTNQAGIPGVIRPGAVARLIKSGFRSAEGPIPAPDGTLYFSAVDESRTYKLGTSGTITVWKEGTNETNGLYITRDNRLLRAEGSSHQIVALSPDGKATPLASHYKGTPLRRPNDLIVDKKGGIYFTDPAVRPAPNVAPKDPGNVYYIRPTGELVLVDDQVGRPNGITLSLDEKTLYVDDTEGEFVYAFDVQPDGTVKNRREFVHLLEPERTATGASRSRSDGMALDSQGRLYVTSSAGVQVIAPSGRHLGIIRLPDHARNLAFGGPKRQTLYLTMFDALYQIDVLSHGPKGRSK